MSVVAVFEVMAGDPGRGLAILLDAERDPTVAGLPLRDRGYADRLLLLGMVDLPADARAVLEEGERTMTPETTALTNYVQVYLWTLERPAPLYERLGELERALELRGRFVELWDGADADLQLRVEAARERIGVLEGGGVAVGGR